MKLLQIINNPIMPIIYLINKYGFFNFSDEFYIKNFYRYKFGKKLDLDNPKTFNEKLQWLKINDRKNIYTKMVDKYEAKKIVGKIIDNKHIIPTFGIYNSFDEIDFDKLPNEFVCKCTHDSGGLVIVKDKKSVNIHSMKRKIDKSLKRNYYHYFAREWPYKNVKPRIIIEKYEGDNLSDYKIFCFNGEPKFTLVCSNRNGNFKNTDFYDNDWNLMPFTRENHENSRSGIKKPEKLTEMLDIARKLSKNIPFVRVDLYDINEKIYFGELTFYPSGGFEGFCPSKWDEKIGDLLDLSMVNKK